MFLPLSDSEGGQQEKKAPVMAIYSIACIESNKTELLSLASIGNKSPSS